MKYIEWDDIAFNIADVSILYAPSELILVRNGTEGVKLSILADEDIKALITGDKASASRIMSVAKDVVINFISSDDAYCPLKARILNNVKC